jgi:hypothetical protein
MPQENENLLAVLKAELAFVESGGYSTPKEATWRPHFIFQDSPTCLNFRNRGNRVSCSKCWLIQLVPKNRQQERFPCRYIPLDEFGQTLDFLYRTGTEEETYDILASWLRANIARLEPRSDSRVSDRLPEESVPLAASPH